MKKSILMILAGSVLAIYSCGDKNTASENTSSETTDQPAVTEEAAPVSPSEATNEITDGTAPVAAVPADVAPTDAGALNPAHGEPGHRCDISVGAPLSSAPTANPGTSTPVLPGPGEAPATQRIEMPATNAPATVTAPGMNPPHGEPGHDCAVAVGAPLKK